MNEHLLQPSYWGERLRAARIVDRLHESVFRGVDPEWWKRMTDYRRKKLAEVVKPEDSVLDAGCCWGWLLDILPDGWKGDYLGVDLSPDFVALARQRYPGRAFVVGDLLKPETIDLGGRHFTWAYVGSVKSMFTNQIGGDSWERIEAFLRSVADDLIVYEYQDWVYGT
jgi:SAM-dependent methyltransferase